MKPKVGGDVRMMLVGFAGLLMATPAAALTESDYRERFCAGMAQERVLANGTRVDCLTDEMAIEVDWTHKWAEAVGQSLSYAATTGRRPGIILVCKVGEQACLKHELLINESVSHWNLPVTLWLCLRGDEDLAHCKRGDF
ncbi:hypothetical protein ACRQ1B_03330 [Rhizobium panacihumi]|uniref:hypothetical protein n=1 Tax=Rhizobium panacihumi TaxID=2008450 RepID=UPI003D7A2E36